MKTRLTKLAALIQGRNRIDCEIAALLNRPAERSHIGEFLARAVFDISEPTSASQANSDGVFQSGSLCGKSVNIEFYGKDDGCWDVKNYPAVDYYLVLCGDLSGAASSRGQTRPLIVSHVYVTPESMLQTAGVKPGVAASVRQKLRFPYRVYPAAEAKATLQLNDEQRVLLGMFAEVGR